MSEEPKPWPAATSSPLADIAAERERITRAFDEIGREPFVPNPDNPFTQAFAALEKSRAERRMTARYVEGCRCGCSDGRRVR